MTSHFPWAQAALRAMCRRIAAALEFDGHVEAARRLRR